MISVLGIVAPFWLDAISNLAIVGALLWWRPRRGPGTLLPAERFGRAMLTGFRYARHNSQLRHTLIRAVGLFYSRTPIGRYGRLSRGQIAGGANLYGLLLGVIGAGSVTVDALADTDHNAKHRRRSRAGRISHSATRSRGILGSACQA
jgi:Transmembrane secretion effector